MYTSCIYMDLFENTIICRNCNIKMGREDVVKSGFKMRSVVCDKCDNRILHPEDVKEFENFSNLKKKNYRVKLRFVGNSYAVSIPREIVDFMNEQERQRIEMVNLCFEEFGRISLNF
jgi:hypothetical protein